MEVHVLLLFMVGCSGIQWKVMDDFKKSFEEYRTASLNSISHIQNVLDGSRKDSELFLNNTYSNNPAVKMVLRRRLSNGKCFRTFINESNLKFKFENKLYQLQIPLRSRLVEIRDNLNKINSSIEIYGRIAESVYRSCKSLHGNCFEETNEWLRSIVYSLTCAIHPDCQLINRHNIKKRTICPSNHFKCDYGKCFPGNFFCDAECDCRDCSDEPNDCIRDCPTFRCKETFLCILNDKRCDGKDDCGDGTDEEDCEAEPSLAEKISFRKFDCSFDSEKFLCSNGNCIHHKMVCDGHDDCGDWSDEGVHCQYKLCSSKCAENGGVCAVIPEGPRCVYECPPETYETSFGCSHTPDAPLTTLVQILNDTPRLTTRYAGRLKFLKNKTVRLISDSLEEVVKCLKHSLYSSSEHNEKGSAEDQQRNIKPITVIHQENMTGILDDDKIIYKQILDTKSIQFNKESGQVKDDRKVAGIPCSEYESDENHSEIRPSTNATTTPSNKPAQQIEENGNMPGESINGSGNDKTKAISRSGNDKNEDKIRLTLSFSNWYTPTHHQGSDGGGGSAPRKRKLLCIN